VLSIVASIVYPALAGWANVRRAYGARDSFGMAGARGARSGEANSPLQKARNSPAMKKKDAGLPDANRRDSHKTGESPALRTGARGTRVIYFVEACFMGDGKFERMRVSTRD